MTYGQVKNQVLRLLNQYTIAGAAVADTYNNQADYIKRIPSLINDAMMELSTTVRKIEQVVPLSPDTWDSSALALHGNCYSFAMPEDFFAFKSGSNWLLLDGRPVPHQLYAELGAGRTRLGIPQTRGKHYLTLPKELVENHEVVMTYYCYPELLDDDPDDSVELDNTVDAQLAIPYYVAGVLALHDDPFLASSLMNAWEDKLQKMTPIPSAEIAPVQDVYGMNTGHGHGIWCE